MNWTRDDLVWLAVASLIHPAPADAWHKVLGETADPDMQDAAQFMQDALTGQDGLLEHLEHLDDRLNEIQAKLEAIRETLQQAQGSIPSLRVERRDERGDGSIIELHIEQGVVTV